MSNPVYPPRRPGSAYAERDDQTCDLGRPVKDSGEDLSKVYPRRVKPVDETTAPPRRPSPEAADLPPRRPGSAAARPAARADDDLPPRRGQTSPEPTEGTHEAVPPQRRYTSAPASAAAPSPPAAPTGDGDAGKPTAPPTSDSVTAEIEEILQMLEAYVTDSKLEPRDLHTLASLIFGLGKHVSRLAVEKEQAGARSASNPTLEPDPEPED